MRVLCSADLHGDAVIYDWLLTKASHERVDALALAGDLLGCPDFFETREEAQRHDASRFGRLLGEIGLPVFYIMGNDDLVELDPPSPHVQSLDGRRVQCGSVGFVGYQYSLPFRGGTFEKPEGEIAADLAGLVPLLDGGVVFVSQSPARGIIDPGVGDMQIGIESLRELLEHHPCLAHVHGHSHAGFGRAGNHFNVASARRRRAIVLDLSKMSHQVLED